jgi:DNA-binding NtrC family response regulator
MVIVPGGHDAPAGGSHDRERATARQVMVVDDDASVLAVLEGFLTAWGYRTLPFGSFEDARVSLLAHVPDALVVDIRLGGYNGVQLVYLAKQANPAMIAVVVSGFDDPVLRAEAAHAGATAYLVKPLEFSRLRQCLAGNAPDTTD